MSSAGKGCDQVLEAFRAARRRHPAIRRNLRGAGSPACGCESAAISGFGEVVMIVQERIGEPSAPAIRPTGRRRRTACRSCRCMKCGTLVLVPGCGLPFVEAIGRDQATFVFVCAAESGLLGQRLAAGVDQAVADGGIFCPGGDQAPDEEIGCVRAIVGDGQHRPARAQC